MALLELDLAEFKALTQVMLSDPPDNTRQQLKEELQQLKRDNQALASDLRGSLEALKQENSVLHVQLAKLKEDAENRERSFIRQVQHLTDRLSSVSIMTSTETQALPARVPNLCIVSVPPSLLCTQPNSTLALPDTSTQPAANSQPCPSQLPSTQPEEQAPQVVLLADSNGKFLDTNKLFPGKKVLSKRCSTTGQAMKLLKKETLKSPQCLVIHTGTNDLHSLRKDTAEAVKKMAEQASREFPNTRIVVSTLLPRTDTPPHVIHDINMEIRRGCATLPNVHLALHPTWDLYDGLYLHKIKVKILAKTLQEAALGHNRSNRSPSAVRPTPIPGSLSAAQLTPAPGSLSAARPTPPPGSPAAAWPTPVSGPLSAVPTDTKAECSGPL